MPWRSPQSGGERDVGGRVAEHATPRVAGLDLAHDEPAVAEPVGRARDIAPGKRFANIAGREGRTGIVADRIDDGDGEAAAPPCLRKERGRPSPPLAETEVEPNHRRPSTQRIDDDAIDEPLRRRRGERPVEIGDDKRVHRERAQDARLGVERRQPEHRSLGLEYRSGVRFEGQHQRRRAEPHRLVAGRLDQRRVPAVHAVEVADRNDAAGEAGWQRIELDWGQRLKAGARCHGRRPSAGQVANVPVRPASVKTRPKSAAA